MDPVVSLQNLSVRQGKRLLLDRVSLEIPAGGFVAVLGANGAGKTTLLRVLQGELAPDEGSRRVLGTDPRLLGWRDAARWRRRIGVMPQLVERSEAVPLSVREVVELARVAAPDEIDDAEIERWLGRLGVGDLAERPFERLSGGERRRTHLARVFAQKPELVLLDEPAGHLDFPAQETLVALLRDLWKESRVTVVLVTHELRHLPPELSQVVLLRDGRIVSQGIPDKTLDSESLSRTFGQDVEVRRQGGRWSAETKVPHG